jgi:hypothetical protein
MFRRPQITRRWRRVSNAFYRRNPRVSWQPRIVPQKTSLSYTQWAGAVTLTSVSSQYNTPASTFLVGGTFTVAAFASGFITAPITIELKDKDNQTLSSYQWDATQNAPCLTFFIPLALQCTNVTIAIAASNVVNFNGKLHVSPP